MFTFIDLKINKPMIWSWNNESTTNLFTFTFFEESDPTPALFRLKMLRFQYMNIVYVNSYVSFHLLCIKNVFIDSECFTNANAIYTSQYLATQTDSLNNDSVVKVLYDCSSKMFTACTFASMLLFCIHIITNET